ncbi:hypothetical protein, partial [Candidatus Cyanaurora vandensis]
MQQGLWLAGLLFLGQGAVLADPNYPLTVYQDQDDRDDNRYNDRDDDRNYRRNYQDRQEPQLQVLSPAPGATIQAQRPVIRVRLQDRGNSGVDRSTLRIFLDRTEVTGVPRFEGDEFYFRPSWDLKPGFHRLALVATDRAGNRAEEVSSFTVDDQNNNWQDRGPQSRNLT